MSRGRPQASSPISQPSPTGAIVSDVEAIRLEQEYGDRVHVKWGGLDRPWNEPQKKVLTCLCDEILCAGGKGGGKSDGARAWLVSGNPHLPAYDDKGAPIPWNLSYAYHPGYHGLILRKNEDDLREFILRATEMYRPFGGQFVSGQFRFTSGAVIDCGHMRDANSWQKYLGIEYQRIVIDEAALIKDFSSYDQIRTCLRTTYPELRLQILLTSNANGPGVAWITPRFMEVKDPLTGDYFPPGTEISEQLEDPDTGEKFTNTRIWIFSTYRDNPAVMRTGYGRQLASISDAKLRRAYLDGDWYALFGSYFGDVFRNQPKGHRQGEPENANHVIPVEKFKPQPWWHMTSAMDWGLAHESSFLLARIAPNKQLYIYREIVAAGVSPVQFGFEIATMVRPELEKFPSKSLVMHLSHDAFQNRTGEKTIAELIAMGMARVLGPEAIHLPDLLVKQIKESFEVDAYNPLSIQKRDAAIEALLAQKRLGITIRIAEKASVIGWQHCREYMRFEPVGIFNDRYDPAVANRLLQEDLKAFEIYSKTYKDTPQEVLPKLQIVDTCPRLIDAIPRAQHEEGTENMDKTHFLGKDSVDSLCYLIGGIRSEAPQEPFEAYRTRELEQAMLNDPNLTGTDLRWINMGLEEQWKERSKNVAPYTPPRNARASRLIRQGKLGSPSNPIPTYRVN